MLCITILKGNYTIWNFQTFLVNLRGISGNVFVYPGNKTLSHFGCEFSWIRLLQWNALATSDLKLVGKSIFAGQGSFALRTTAAPVGATLQVGSLLKESI